MIPSPCQQLTPKEVADAPSSEGKGHGSLMDHSPLTQEFSNTTSGIDTMTSLPPLDATMED